MDEILSAAVAAARAAGEIALQYFRTNLTVETKADHTPVTRADRECEARIVEFLSARFPDYGFLGEEFGERPGRINARWIIDPIDGTKNFIRGIPFFATLIALEEAGEVTTGVMHAPAVGDLLYARKGQGAFANGRQVQVSAITDLRDAMLIHGGLKDLKVRPCWQPFLRLVDTTARQRGFGDALGHSVVICGQAEVALEPEIKPWDVAATKIIVTEAGGRFSDFAGSPSIYTGSAVISNGHVHDQVLNLLEAM
ncbi:MAG TPA: inositol monophosphatase family protein [Candidatus Binatia bacterium]|jgi:histidinol phosphatase-like enzyme (inositol monophosphatase family)|nr:inositol monophosphatase family protein [Candidatus Binatia bacterium]